MVMEYYGQVESMSADFSKFQIKKDGDGETFHANKIIVTDAAKGGVRFEIGSHVAFTISLDGSEVLSLRKCD